MAEIRYCTPEWLEAIHDAFRSNPDYEERLKKLTTKVGFLIWAEPSWGIEEDIIFCSEVVQGKMLTIGFSSDSDARQNMDFIMAASAQEWKKLLRRENKLLTDFMLGKVTLEHGSRVGVLSLIPHIDAVMELLTEVELQFQDEMAEREVQAYREEMLAYRQENDI
jgi:hypothetical protein